MKPFSEQYAEYQQQHKERVHQITHYIGIPAILLGILILLSWVSISIAAHWHITFAWIGVVLLLVYYYFFNIKISMVMTVFLIILTLLCSWLAYPAPTQLSLILFFILFIGGWLLLFVGHSLEKSKPTFSFHIPTLVMTPLFFVADLLIALKLGKYFDLPENHAIT
jgi:uncharacterized membrane protein YGL010W